MSAILHLISHPDAAIDDPHGNLYSLNAWSEEIALQTAAEMDLWMYPAHWEVVTFLRAYYRDYGIARNARELLNLLCEKFAPCGGRRYLYQLFPGGPVNQASRIAGLPVPASSTDASSGYRH
ncbi:MAG: TusE/DsrC/DsvC family sulfur relay protein [Gammaproteobacteria bacterium]|nr:TusE/DsrC/DsvC family sulfur relay protein [Gammaproteobacteria bacterium]MCP5135515.1 TusE/DsrC/DsvC family sulfur relay protein [Gammaproteobacteria bacterium]